MTKMESNQYGELPQSIEVMEQALLETRVEKKVVEVIDFALEGDWVDYKKVLEKVKNVLGAKPVKIISQQPKKYFDECSVVMYRRTNKDNLHVSTKGMFEGYYIELHDREEQLMKDIARTKRKARSLKRKRDQEARRAEEEKRKKSKTGETVPSGAYIKCFALEDCCSIFADPEFALEMGVLNKGVKIKLDLHSMKSESVRMIHPLRCWVCAEEMPLDPDEVRKYGGNTMSEDESCEENGTNTDSQNQLFDVESCVTFNLCRVYRKKKAKSKYEIATLHKGNFVYYDKTESGGGWFKVIRPLPGWIRYEELSAPGELSKAGETKESVIDLTSETAQSASKEAIDEEAMKTEKEEGKTSEMDSDKENAEDKLNGATNEKNNNEKQAAEVVKENTINGATKTMDIDEVEESTEVAEAEDATIDEEEDSAENKIEEAEATENKSTKSKEVKVSDKEPNEKAQKTAEPSTGKEVIDISVDSAEDEIYSDDDWDEFEDPEEETLSGNWSCGQKGGCFTLEQLEDGVLDGYLENKETCSIEGKVEGDDVWFNQNWQKGSVHGVGVVTSVKGTYSDRMRVMNLKFEATSKKGKKITGKNLLYKDPICDLTGVWYPQDSKLGMFSLTMTDKGKISGYMDSDSCCKVTGRLTSHLIRFKQHWQVKPTKGSELKDEYLVTTVEGFVNKKGTKMCLSYSHPLPDGTSVSGVIVLRKKTSRALAGLWVSGDQGGRFVFQEGEGQRFNGYLDTNGTCRIDKGTVSGFTISFRQVWLSGSSHKGAVATVKGVANNNFTKLDLTYRCNKKGRKEIKGKSVLNKLEGITSDKDAVLNNGCFNGTHSAFPPNVFQQFQGFKMYGHHSGENRFPIYTRTQKILILGEADFSFTLAMMRAFKRSFSIIIGTSYMRKWGLGKPPPSWNNNPRKRQFLNEAVRKLDPTLDEISERGGYCRFGVDARNLENTIFADHHVGKWCGKIPKVKFDRIIFPFPRASLSRFHRVEDTDLMRGTFRSCQKMLTPGGELHLILHTSRQGVAQLDLWGVRDLAEDENMVWRAALPFDPKKMPAYNPKDVTGTPWRPYEPRVHVFTPRHSEWRPESRAWRH